MANSAEPDALPSSAATLEIDVPVERARAVRAFLEAAKQFFEPYLLQIHVGVRRYGLLLSIEREHSRDMAAGDADIDWIQ
jgi:hypothetical protein